MPWNNASGGNSSGGGSGPWGRGSAPGGSGGKPPNLEDMLRRGQDRLRGVLPGGGGGFGRGGLILLGLIVVAVWLASGVYFVGAFEQGIVLRFGKFVARTAPGINYHLPWPIESAYTLDVTRQRQINIGYKPADPDDANSSPEDIPAEADMLTGDENIIDVNFTVYWVVKDAGDYLFNVEDPDSTIKAVAESAMREVVGRSQFESILTQDREEIQIEVKDLMQKTLDSYGAGVTVTNVNMQKADPPNEVIDAYRDVQAARADQERMRNEAEGYANKVIPTARGAAAQIVQDAEAYRQKVIAEAAGEAKRFLAVLEQYRRAPDVTRKRMYLETMAGILGPMNKVIVDDGAKGVVPYFQLPNMLGQGARPPATSDQQQAGGSQQ